MGEVVEGTLVMIFLLEGSFLVFWGISGHGVGALEVRWGGFMAVLL